MIFVFQTEKKLPFFDFRMELKKKDSGVPFCMKKCAWIYINYRSNHILHSWGTQSPMVILSWVKGEWVSVAVTCVSGCTRVLAWITRGAPWCTRAGRVAHGSIMTLRPSIRSWRSKQERIYRKHCRILCKLCCQIL